MDLAYRSCKNTTVLGRYPRSRKSALTEDWFKGLSGKFLASRAGKLLLLAGTDRLDKPLMIGQMQGSLSGGVRLTK